jgi:cephalosporin-C deacetylase-like acetyl esterase
MPPRKRWRLRKPMIAGTLVAAASLVFFLHAADIPAVNPGVQLTSYFNGVAQSYLDQREHAIAQIQTRAQAESRKSHVHETVLRRIGGLPDIRGPLAVQQIGTLHENGFHVERIIYDSLPNFHVTADLYVPDAAGGPYPAVIYTPGHSPVGKLEAWVFAANMASNGIAVLAYDPMGEGERLQYFDPATGVSSAERATGEHSESSIQTMLIGEQISRYFVWDAMRGIDYLSSRPDIDPQRIGAFGCSGGGTVTAYLAALDDRVKVAGVACYITTFQELLKTLGPQEAEQSIPGFIQDGFDFADWVETAAPKPFAIVSTTEDMFPYAGARHSYEEAKRIYELYGSADHLQWIVGPGTHGQLRPIYPNIIGFFMEWLEHRSQLPDIEQFNPPPAKDLLCTSTGQVSSSLSGETIYSINKQRAAALLPAAAAPLTNRAQLVHFEQQLEKEVRAAATITAKPGSPPPNVRILATVQRTSYRLDTIALSSATGIDLTGVIAVPNSAARKPAILMLQGQPAGAQTAPGGDLDTLASSGHIVFALELLPETQEPKEQKSAVLGDFYLPSLRAILVGQTLVGLRVDDVLRAVDWLSSRPDVDRAHIAAYGSGPMGIVLLHAALLDARIREITLDHTLTSYRMGVDQLLPRGLAQSVVPGVLRRYDLGDLMLGICPRPVTVISPTDAEDHVVADQAFRKDLTWVFDSDRNLHQPGRIRIISRQAGDRLPMDAIVR